MYQHQTIEEIGWKTYFGVFIFQLRTLILHFVFFTILRISTYVHVKRKKVKPELFPDICRNDLIEVNCSSSAWNRLLPFIFQEVWSIILLLHLINKVVAALVLI